MRVLFFVAAVLLSPVIALAQAPDAAPSTPVEIVELAAFEPTREEAVLEAYVDGVVAAHMREHDIPGVSVSIVRNGRPLFVKGYGFADIDGGERASGDETLFRIGSVSKTFIWTAVMMLAERGAIDLDADVNTYLKGVEIPEKFGAPVTMNHLMAHRAGFEDTFGVFTIPREGDISLTDALNKNMPARVFPPGARTSYSNWGSALAAKIIEDVTGETYEDFLFLEILNPLGMSSTALSGPASMPPALRARLAKGYELKAGALVEADLMNIGPYAPAGAMSMTAEDMTRWMQLHLGGGSVDNVRLMTPQTHGDMWGRAFSDRSGGADLAHGFFSRSYRGYDAYGHGGATAAFYTYMDLIPELGIGVYVSQNATTDRTLVSDLSKLVIDHVVGEASRNEDNASEAATAQANDAAGVYLGNRRSFTQFEKAFALSGATTVAVTEGGSVTVSGSSGAMRYDPVEGAPDLYENRHGDRVAFSRDDEGRITHFTGVMGVHSADRISFLSHPVALGGTFGAAVLFAATTFAGAWRRQGRAVAQTATGRALGLADMAAALVVFLLLASMVATVGAMSSLGVTDLVDYPMPAINMVRLVGAVFVVVALLGVVSLFPAWRMSGWTLWRKGHHTLFILALAALAFFLVQWKIVFAATA
ncbi:MAG: serine hydrolase domain-containing protein [Pseudomonadota bacterium]